MNPTISMLDYVTNPMVIFGAVVFLIGYLGTQRPPPETKTADGKPKKDIPVLYTFAAAAVITLFGLYGTYVKHQQIKALQQQAPVTEQAAPAPANANTPH